MLKYIDDVCKKNNIKYFLDCGTLLGAARHQGFIPWDDDIDILVDRQDYKKLLSLLSNKKSQYRALSMYNTPEYHYLFAKLVDTETELIEDYIPIKGMGVFIDIFPLDHLPSNKVHRRFVQFYINIMRSALRLRLEGSQGRNTVGIKHKMVLILSYLFSGSKEWKGLMNKLDLYLLKNANRNTKVKVDVVSSTKPYRDVPAAYFDDSVMLKFEDGYYPAPKAYKEYLTILYGDYMTLPPENARVSNHDFKAYMRQ